MSDENIKEKNQLDLDEVAGGMIASRTTLKQDPDDVVLIQDRPQMQPNRAVKYGAIKIG